MYNTRASVHSPGCTFCRWTSIQDLAVSRAAPIQEQKDQLAAICSCIVISASATASASSVFPSQGQKVSSTAASADAEASGRPRELPTPLNAGARKTSGGEHALLEGLAWPFIH